MERLRMVKVLIEAAMNGKMVLINGVKSGIEDIKALLVKLLVNEVNADLLISGEFVEVETN